MAVARAIYSSMIVMLVSTAFPSPMRYDFGSEITVYQGSQGLCCTSRKREPLYAFYAVTNDGRMNRLSGGDNWRTTWDMIIPGDFGGDGKTDLLFYDRDAGLYAFYTVSSNGKLSRLSDGDNWRKTWDMIIPVNFGGDGKTDLLFYDRDAGLYAFYTVSSNGKLSRLSDGDNWRKTQGKRKKKEPVIC
jgi:hypothetical protein